MERIPAACAMEWSIELDKGLRSPKPGKSAEAILEIGKKLEWWNRDPGLKLAEYAMFGLIPGEDKLFATTILLRLADAFRLGDKHTKFSISKAFYTERRNRKNNRQNDGILLKVKAENNHLELLKRVKMSFDDGDAEVRALSLVLFGCWASIAKDSAAIRYCILSSLVSSDLMEVKASLFAAECFCELSDDFACVVFEILVNMLSSSETPVALKLIGIRALAKLGCSSSLANIAYKAALKLPVDSSEDKISIAVLISLTKIASKSTHLISGQLDMLLSFLNQDKGSHIQSTTLRCLLFILGRGACFFVVKTNTVKTLCTMLSESKFPPELECKALQTLNKLLLYSLPSFPCEDVVDLFSDLLKIVNSLIKSPILSKRQSASSFLVEMFAKFMRREDISPIGVSSSMASQVISFVTDQMKSTVDLHQPDTETELKGLLDLLHLLAEECQNLCGTVLDSVYSFIEYLVNKHEGAMLTHQTDLVESIPFIELKFVLYISKVLISCIESLHKAEAPTATSQNSVKLLIELVHKCRLFNIYSHTVNSVLWHSYITCYLEERSSVSYDSDSIGTEIQALECVKKLLDGTNKWPAYKAGKYAACNGAWFTAAYVFQELIPTVRADPCYRWLKSLAEFARCEMTICTVVLPDQGSKLLGWFKNNSALPIEDNLRGVGERTTVDNLIRASSVLGCSVESMGAIFTPGRGHYFQRWFLELRVKVVQALLDIVKILGSENFTQDGNQRCLQELTSLVYPLTKISSRLTKLAQELDLIAISFIGIDSQSLAIISATALSCSLMAFCTGFALFFPNINSSGSCTTHVFRSFQDGSRYFLIQDLVSRLRYVDGETSAKLVSLSNGFGQTNSCLAHQPGKQISDNCYEARRMISACKYAVNRVVGLQNISKDDDNETSLTKVGNEGLDLVSFIASKWMNLPFRTPNHFFRLRPCVSCELFVSNGGEQTMTVLKGFQLSLNVCVQLKNVPKNLAGRIKKIYCRIYTNRCYKENNGGGGETEVGCRDEMLDSNAKLMQLVRQCGKKENEVDGYGYSECNERGQGLFSCVVDVSGFAVGRYRLKWQCSCLDTQDSYWNLLPFNAAPLLFTVQLKG